MLLPFENKDLDAGQPSLYALSDFGPEEPLQ
jgi:hypothetical protein